MRSNKIYLVGVFDMIHFGHLMLLNKASQFGNLYVGVVCDQAVKRVKGSDRPMICEDHRLLHIKKNRDVYDSYIIPDFEITKEDIEKYDIIVVGADQDHIKGIDLIPQEKRYNLPRTVGVSTSELIKKIKEE